VADKEQLLRSLAIDRTAEAAPETSARDWRLLAGTAAAAALIGAGLAWMVKPTGAPPAQASGPAAEAPAPAAAAAARGGLVASGYVVARRRATVAAEVTGRVLDVRVEEGQVVKRGQVLAVLDATLARAELQSARARAAAGEADIQAAVAELAEAQRVLERTRTLNQRQFASQAALTAAEARVTSLEGRLGQARAARTANAREAERAAGQLARFEIRAPFDGVVVDKAAQPGEIISPISAGGGFTRTGICTIVDMQSLEIEVDVNEAFIARVAPGQRVEAVLDAYPDVILPAKVIATIPTAARDKATVRVRVGFDALDARILPEMAIKVTFLEEA
jgi:RND family efflux transporter MFP subunit